MKLVPVSLLAHQSRIDCLADRLLFHAEASRLYLVSLVGADSAVRAMLAGLSGHSYLEARIDGEWTTIYPDVRGGKSIRARLAESSIKQATRFRGAAGRPAHTLTHGAWIADKALPSSEEHEEICLIDPTPERVFCLLSSRFVAPALPEWTDWIVSRLKEDGRMSDLQGIGTTGCLLRLAEGELDELLSQGVRSGALKF